MNRCLILGCLVSVCLSACLENEEEITIRPDGSASVRMSAKGKPEDLADGYPIPLGGPWIAESESTENWIRVLGSDTGSIAVRDNLQHLAPGANELAKDQDVTLGVHAEFAAVHDIPQWIAPRAEPYRTAYLERNTDLRVETKSGRRVYTFERVFHARGFERFSLWDALEQKLPKDLKQKLDQLDDASVEVDAAERDRLIEFGTSTLIDTSMPYAENALLSVYTAGDASLDPRSVDRVLESVRQSLSAVITRERMAAIVDGWLASAKSHHPGDEDHVKDMERLESEARENVRSSLDSGLAREGVALSTRNAIRGQLEWNFTDFDHTTDLGDEEFRVIVHMPGVVVGGNFDEKDGAAVRWKFDGEGLHDRDRVLRVVSVLD